MAQKNIQPTQSIHNYKQPHNVEFVKKNNLDDRFSITYQESQPVANVVSKSNYKASFYKTSTEKGAEVDVVTAAEPISPMQSRRNYKAQNQGL